MQIDTDIIIYYIRLFITNMYVYYCFEKISNNTKNRFKNYIVLSITNIILLLVYVPMNNYFNSFIPFILLYIMYAMVISKLTKTKLGCSLVLTIMSYAMLAVLHGISVVIQFVPYKILETFYNFDNMYFSLAIIILIQFLLMTGIFKIKRFKNGFAFLTDKLNNEITDIIIINISSIIIIIYCLLQTYHLNLKKNLFVMFFLLGITMYFTIRKMLTMHYKQKLLTDTMDEYKNELEEKQNTIDELEAEKKKVSKITHEFYNRQKALELLVASNMNVDNIDKENVSQNVLNIIQSLTNEYSERFESIKELPKLEETDIPEIDNMFKYMQSECYNNNINFKLKVMGNIYSLVNNIIPKNRLETLIGDHVRDAINAVKLSEIENKEILVIIGLKDKKYELAIYDTGVSFEINTLVKLGLEAVTTNAARGGTGNGFMTTFETLKNTKASLIITEYPDTNETLYTKCVAIRFDGKKQYKIFSHRAEEIKQVCENNRIKVEQYKNS